MGIDPDKSEPFFFTKPADALVQDGAAVPYARGTTDFQYEVELVSVIGRRAEDVSVANALDHVFGYATGLDMTRRDLQSIAKKNVQPWDMGKGFDNSAPCSAVRRASEMGHPREGRIALKKNGEIVQQSDLANQIWQIDETIAYLSKFITLLPGDLIFHGTPEGVGPVEPGDQLEATIASVADLSVRIVSRSQQDQ